MFVSRKKWDELKERLYKLEQKQKELENGQKITTGLLDGYEYRGFMFFRKYKALSLKQAVKMIMEHLNLKISEQPEQKAKFELVKKDKETQEEAPQ